MKRTIGLLLIALLASGCDRYIESEDMSFPPPEEPPLPVSLKITHLPDVIRLDWQATDTITGMRFRVYHADSLDGAYSLLGTASDFTYATGSLSSGQRYYFKISSVTPEGLEGKMSSAVSTIVGVVSAVINGGDKYTNSRDVTISFVVPLPALLMQVAEDESFAGAHWENFSVSKLFRLSAGDGTKSVYARFRFNDGSETDSAAAVSDSIILDTHARIDSVYFVPSGIALAKDSTVKFYLTTDETDGSAAVSFPGVSSLALVFDEAASDTLIGRCVYSIEYVIPGNIEAVDAPLLGRFTDAAGNVAMPVTSSELLNISNPPTPVTLVAVAESASGIRLNWSQSIDNDFAAYQIYRSITEDVSNTSSPIAIISSKSTLTFVDGGLDESTEYYYRIYVYDKTGLWAPSNVASAETYINEPPHAVTLSGRIDGGEVTLSWTAGSDEDFESYRMYRAADSTVAISQIAPLEIISSKLQTTASDSPSAGTYYYNVAVFDLQGKWTPSNWIEIIVP
ncbi:MAG: fibronectin type III domain-containing protein [Candidatus Zixiibacteriota bacterium]|nr:MAG: fibronectin type III domain-containing protein [candidate division Zixibacteria bacterium]